MLAAIALVLASSMAIVLQFQWNWVRRFHRLFQVNSPLPFSTRGANSPQASPTPPRAAVVLSLRGADPFLTDCVRGILSQDYPDYQVRIIVDSDIDPAYAIVESVVKELQPRHVQVDILTAPLQTCSLKTSAIIQAVESFPDDREVLVVADADVVPGPDWLARLTRPLLNPRVGISSGIRWYSPAHSNPGTLVRWIWSVFAAVQLHEFRGAFGGSMAMRLKDVQRLQLLEQWKRALFEDLLAADVFSRAGLENRFIPEVTLINRERTSLESCLRFMRRQMLNSRLYLTRWPFILGYALCSSLGMLGSGLLLGWAIALQDVTAAAITAISLVLYVLVQFSTFVSLELMIQRQFPALSHPAPGIPWQAFPAGFLTQGLYFWSLLSILFVRQIDWRGIQYNVHAPFDIRLVKYTPYTPLLPVNELATEPASVV